MRFAASILIGSTEIHDAIEKHEEAYAASKKKEEPGYRERIARDLSIARRCHWPYHYVRELDPDVYDVLVEQLNQEAAAGD
jgi:hypothetical protein